MTFYLVTVLYYSFSTNPSYSSTICLFVQCFVIIIYLFIMDRDGIFSSLSFILPSTLHYFILLLLLLYYYYIIILSFFLPLLITTTTTFFFFSFSIVVSLLLAACGGGCDFLSQTWCLRTLACPWGHAREPTGYWTGR